MKIIDKLTELATDSVEHKYKIVSIDNMLELLRKSKPEDFHENYSYFIFVLGEIYNMGLYTYNWVRIMCGLTIVVILFSIPELRKIIVDLIKRILV